MIRQPTKPVVVEIDRFVLCIDGQHLSLYNNGELVADHVAPGMVDDIGDVANRLLGQGHLRIGYIDYGESEVVSIFDGSDEYGFGYHWNISDGSMSEWGDSSDLPSRDESIGDFVQRQEAWKAEMRDKMGDAFIDVGPKAIRRVISTPVG